MQQAKEAAARYAADVVEDGMVLGLGTGSTAALFVAALGERVKKGLRVRGVPTSEATARQARDLGIPLSTLEETPRLDLDIDGADAIDPQLNLLKGLGGALLREKIVAAASRRFLVIADESKLVASLADAPLVPVEVIPFGWSRTAVELEDLGATVKRRLVRDSISGEALITDSGHYILDCHFENMLDPLTLAEQIKSLVGVVDHGFFIGLATEAVVASSSGVRLLAATD